MDNPKTWGIQQNPFRNRIRRVAAVRLLAAVCLSLGTLTLVPQSSAHAAPSTVRVHGTTATNGDTPKSITVACPAGKRVVGTGANVNNGVPDANLYQVYPNAGLTEVTARASAGSDQSWSLTVYAVCTSTSLPGLERRTSISASNSSWERSAVATCSTGKTLLGTGALLSGSNLNRVVIDDIQPLNGSQRVRVWAVERAGGNPSNWSVTAVAICADISSNQVSRVSSTTPQDSSSSKVRSASCPGNTVLFGGGFALSNGLGRVVVDEFSPNGSANQSPTVQRTVAFEDGAYAGSWQLTTYALCYVLPVT